MNVSCVHIVAAAENEKLIRSLCLIRHAVEFAWLNSVINRVVCYFALDYVMESQ